MSQTHHMDLDEHAQMATPQPDMPPPTWYTQHGLRQVDTLLPGPIEMYEPAPDFRSYRPLVLAMSVSAALVVGLVWWAA